MFHSAALKLTLWYLALIMVLSLVFSTALYRTSSDAILGDAQRQAGYFRSQLSPFDFRDYSQARQKQLDEEHTRLVNRLITFNLLVLVAGGLASYALARRTLKPIEESLEAQTRFTADASHELRTPLAAMQTEIEVALRDPALTKQEAINQLNSNLEEVAKLKALSDGLLRLASTDSSHSFDDKVNLKIIAGQALARWEKIADARKIKINFKAGEARAKGDPQSLVDLVSILLDNAIKYSPEGGEITVKTFKRDKSVFISVSDSGQGIKASDLPHVFERFYRTDASRNKDQSDGYGLGLAIAKKIADLHGGSIEVKSAPGKGSTFTLQLPSA